RRRGRRARRRPPCLDAREGGSSRHSHRPAAVAARDPARGDVRAPLPPELGVVSDERLTLRDGRTLAWKEYGPADGRPVLHFQGTPGSRYSRHAHEDVYDRLGVRLLVLHRPPYGASDPR